MFLLPTAPIATKDTYGGSMFITDERNIDYLIPSVRIHIGDLTEPYRFDDSIVRTALLQGILMLQRRWEYRYFVFTSGMVVTTLPSGYVYEHEASPDETYLFIIPSGYVLAQTASFDPWLIASGTPSYTVVRNPYHRFLDTGPEVISQEDVTPIILAAAIVLRTSQLSSSADVFGSWSDGQFSYSNLGSQRAISDLLEHDRQQLNTYFALRLAKSLRSSFPPIVPIALM